MSKIISSRRNRRETSRCSTCLWCDSQKICSSDNDGGEHRDKNTEAEGECKALTRDVPSQKRITDAMRPERLPSDGIPCALETFTNTVFKGASVSELFLHSLENEHIGVNRYTHRKYEARSDPSGRDLLAGSPAAGVRDADAWHAARRLSAGRRVEAGRARLPGVRDVLDPHARRRGGAPADLPFVRSSVRDRGRHGHRGSRPGTYGPRSLGSCDPPLLLRTRPRWHT